MSDFHTKYTKQPNDGCWLWEASRNKDGYGLTSVQGASVSAHRASYEIHVGKIPDGICVLHTCDVPACVRPDHLFLGTHTDNMRDMYAKGRQPDQRGEGNPNARLTENTVREIRAAPGKQRTIAAKYGITHGMVSMIKNRKKWRHLHG